MRVAKRSEGSRPRTTAIAPRDAAAAPPVGPPWSATAAPPPGPATSARAVGERAHRAAGSRRCPSACSARTRSGGSRSRIERPRSSGSSGRRGRSVWQARRSAQRAHCRRHARATLPTDRCACEAHAQPLRAAPGSRARTISRATHSYWPGVEPRCCRRRRRNQREATGNARLRHAPSHCRRAARSRSLRVAHPTRTKQSEATYRVMSPPRPRPRSRSRLPRSAQVARRRR